MIGVSKKLKKGEVISYSSRIHTFCLAVGVSLFSVGSYIFFSGISFFGLNSVIASSIFLALGTLILCKSTYTMLTTYLVLTNYRVLTSVGLFKAKKMEIEFKDIVSVSHYQNPFQKLINLGRIKIKTKVSEQEITCVKDPKLFIQRIKEQARFTQQVETYSSKQYKSLTN